jgi:hypothetical protein
MRSRDIYLVGSVPLATTSEVFATVSEAFGARLKRMPDGEVGARANWAHFESLFRDNPAFERSDETFRVHEHAPERQRYRLTRGTNPQTVEFGRLGYAENARQSYAIFKELRDQGVIPAGTRFQVGLVPAHSVLLLFAIDAEQRVLEKNFNDAVVRELESILASIPHHDLAVQVDVASAVFARLERGQPSNYGATRAAMMSAFTSVVAELANRVPSGVDLLFHFCYGDANHRHVVEPSDMRVMVDFANELGTKVSRQINLIHMPVPRERADDAYFSPLSDLGSFSSELALGLVHYSDGIDGTRRRMDAASRRVLQYAVATECGFGRRPPHTIPDLLRIHRLAAEYV